MIDHSSVPVVPHDAEAVVVLGADGDLRGRDGGDPAVIELGQDGEIVVERPAGNERLEPAPKPRGRAAGDEPDELVGVRADVAAAARAAGLGWVDPPGGLFLSLGLELGRQPALRIPRLDLADLADRAVLHQFAGEHHHREAGVGVGDDERHLLRGHGRMEASGLVERGGERLLAEHADARGGGGIGGAEVGVVGSDDRQVVDPLRFGQGGFAWRRGSASRDIRA